MNLLERDYDLSELLEAESIPEDLLEVSNSSPIWDMDLKKEGREQHFFRNMVEFVTAVKNGDRSLQIRMRPKKSLDAYHILSVRNYVMKLIAKFIHTDYEDTIMIASIVLLEVYENIWVENIKEVEIG